MALSTNINSQLTHPSGSVYRTLSKYTKDAYTIEEKVLEMISSLPNPDPDNSTKYTLEISTYIISDIDSESSKTLLNKINDACAEKKCECIIKYHSPVWGTPAYIATRISEPGYRTISCEQQLQNITFKPMRNTVSSDHSKTVKLYKQTEGKAELMKTIVTSLNLFLKHDECEMNSFISIDHCTGNCSNPMIITTPFNPFSCFSSFKSPEKPVIDQVVDLIYEAKDYIYLDQTHLSDPRIKQALKARIESKNVDIYINMYPQYGGSRMLGCISRESLVDYYCCAQKNNNERVYISISKCSHAKLVAIDGTVIAGSTNLHRSSRWGVIRETDVKFELKHEAPSEEEQEEEQKDFSLWMILEICNGRVTIDNIRHYCENDKKTEWRNSEKLKEYIRKIINTAQDDDKKIDEQVDMFFKNIQENPTSRKQLMEWARRTSRGASRGGSGS